MRWMDFFRRKESLARTVTTMQQIGKPQATPASFENFAKTGYGKSVMVFRCINMIAGSAKGFSYTLYDKKNPKKPVEVLDHPMLTLWNRPNPMQSTNDLVEAFVAFYCLTGNSYMEANGGVTKGLPLELWVDRPDKMKVIPGPKGYPAAYEVTSGGITRSWPVDILNMKSDILHWKTFHPLNDWYGMSPMEAALLSIDKKLASSKWNLALLQNSATPSGVLQVKTSDANPRGEVTDEQYARMRKDFDENYAGVKNTGRPMIIEGGLSWTSIMMSPKDLENSKTNEMSDMDVCNVYGIPGELVGLGQKTFNNYKEARLALMEETVLPIADSMMGNINRWLSPAFGENLVLEINKDDIEILQWKRDQRYTSIGGATFLNQNEKREALGYPPVEGWNAFVIGTQVGELPEDFTGGGGGFGDSQDDTTVDDEEGDSTGEGTGKPGGKKPKPGKKPVVTDDVDEDEVDDGKGWKSLNLLNRRERKLSWIAQNKRRKRLQVNFNRDLKQDYDELVGDLKKISGNIQDAKLTEYALLRVVNDFMPTMEKTIKRHIKYTLEDFGGMVLGESKTLGLVIDTKANLKFDDFTKRYAESRSGAAIRLITSTTQKEIRKVVGEWVATAIADGDSNAELSKFIEAEFEELTPGQAARIARTEVALASNNGALEAVKSLQIPGMRKEWVSAGDERVRGTGENDGPADPDHYAVSGTEIGIDEKFGVPPDCSMEGPGDTSAPADQVINCRCCLVYRSTN